MTGWPGRAGTPRTPAQQQVSLALAHFALMVAACALGAAGLGVAARPLYMLGGVGIAWFTMRRSPWLYLSATMWFWLLTALVRRVIEWRSGFHPTDPILATPNLMALLMLKPILTTPGLLSRREVAPGMLVAVSVTYGLCISFFRGDVLAGAVAAADWLAPMFYLFYVVANSHEIGSLQPHLRAFLLLSMAVTVPYGLVQYFFLLDWDAAWMINSEMNSIGQPFPLQVRVFGTTNHPGFLATWLGFCILLAPFLRSKVLLALVPPTVFLLVLTLVRSVYGAVALALLLSALLGRGHALKPLMTVVLVLASLSAGLALVSPVVAGNIIARLQTFENLGDDDSAQTRKLIYQQMPDVIAAHPLGLGIGALGRGAVASGDADLIHVDSGPLAAYLALGWAGGSAYIMGLLFAAGQALAAARRHPSPLVLAFACAAICPLAIFPFINVINFSGTVMWLCFGCAIALSLQRTGPRDAARLSPPRFGRRTTHAGTMMP